VEVKGLMFEVVAGNMEEMRLKMEFVNKRDEFVVVMKEVLCVMTQMLVEEFGFGEREG
jgi:hypothetical protein